MPGPTPKPLQLGHDNAVVDLVPTVHDQMAGHRIHGVELAASVGGTQHRLVVCASSDGMREACDSGVTRARGVNGRDIGRLCAERTAIVEALRLDSTDAGSLAVIGVGGHTTAQTLASGANGGKLDIGAS